MYLRSAILDALNQISLVKSLGQVRLGIRISGDHKVMHCDSQGDVAELKR
jgi:hypothetical protein